MCIFYVVEELRNLLDYYEQEETYQLLAVSLSARKNLCIHPQVSQQRSGKAVDGRCQDLTASFKRARRVNDKSIDCCDFFEVSFHLTSQWLRKRFESKNRIST